MTEYYGTVLDTWNKFMHDGQKRLVFTSDRVGVEIVSGVLRALKDLVKILNAVISSAKSDVGRTRTFHFLPTPLMTPSLRFAYDLVKTRLSELEAQTEG